MKKLLFIILTLLFATELFAYDCKQVSVGIASMQGRKQCGDLSAAGYNWLNYPNEWSCNFAIVSTKNIVVSDSSECNQKRIPIDENLTSKKFCFYSYESDKIECISNPDPNSNSPRCDDTFIKDGQFYNCDPSTNEAEFVENSEGFEEKEDGIYPKCKAGYSVHNIGRLTSSGTENQFYCLKNSNDEPSKWVGQTPIDTSNSSGSYYTPNSGKDYSWQDNQGNSYNYTPSTGVLITKDAITGSMSAHAVGSSFQPGDSFTPNGLGYAPNPDGSYGNGGTGGDGNNNGSVENPNPNPTNPDEPIDNEPASNSCNDSSLTLQEKMLCEMNKGIKKLNSESAPSNSLNQLMKDLNNKSTQLNDSFDTIKNNTNVTNQNLNTTNTKLDSLNTNTTQTNTKLDKLDTTLNKLDSTLKDIEKNTKTTSNVLGGSTVSTGGGSNTGSGENGNGEDSETAGDKFKDDDSSSKINDLNSETKGVLSEFTNAVDNVKNGYTSIIDNHKTLINFLDGKKSQSTELTYTYINSLEKTSLSVFNKTLTFDCFFNLDIASFFAPIRPFLTFFFNAIFIYIVIRMWLVEFRTITGVI